MFFILHKRFSVTIPGRPIRIKDNSTKDARRPIVLPYNASKYIEADKEPSMVAHSSSYSKPCMIV